MTKLTKLWLNSNNFSGQFPDFSRLTWLTNFAMLDNSITGQVPTSLVNLPRLTAVRLMNNLLQGPTPKFNSSVMVDTENGSNSFCLLDPGVACDPRVNTLLLIAESVGYPTVFAKKWKGNDPCNNWLGISCVNQNITFVNFLNLGLAGTISPNFSSVLSLESATNNFSKQNILGTGGFGTVYKGELHDGTKIAVKRMESGLVNERVWDQFKSEIVVLSKVRHRHLVSLLGYCLDGNERLLVYEYMPQGTISRHLFRWNEEGLKALEWWERLTIALDVARGVEYLHGLGFIHRDLKPSNILLGADMHAKVADFGFVRLAPDEKSSVLTKLAGTFGYVAPEYAVTGRVTVKIDVFSFGVILMQLITGKKAVVELETRRDEYVGLVTWFRKMRMHKVAFHKAIDPVIDLNEETLASICIVADLAGHCCAKMPSQRPNICHAVNVLSSLVELWKPLSRHSEKGVGSSGELKLKDQSQTFQNELPQFFT
ncbi:hypothetical protein ACSBR1_040056 [Camellia fascicularis]